MNRQPGSTARAYHEATKHTADSLRRSTHYLDWANMPDPFRHYEGSPVLDLAAGPPAPNGIPPAGGADLLSQMFFYSAAISASKLVPSAGYRYALRVNPSSGNLHPTEFHFFTQDLRGWPAGLYHYRASSHMAGQRATGGFECAPVTILLTSIAWREEWKYRDRAYRYCLHDAGHAWQSVALAAAAMGLNAFARGRFDDAELARTCRLNADEWPMLLIDLSGIAAAPSTSPPVYHTGEPNRLSEEVVAYPRIERVHAATSVVEPVGAADPAAPGSGGIHLPAPEPHAIPFAEAVRNRRSALDFIGGVDSISLAQLSALLSAATKPFRADFAGTPFVQLYLYVHRVADLAPGVYRYWPSGGELEVVHLGDQRVMAAALSLRQDLAGNACVAFSMIADLDRALQIHGDRGYRYVHFEAGAIGQRLYVAAESLGLRATGIGAFFDDEVTRYLGVPPSRQVVYHFAVGYPVFDNRVDAG